ncbi:hypothetical protein GCM10009430_07940 [Aquimarina litoralis]|uniref:Uncharacterized protein n=1 Tax=Aquimarina litoralis TaxID=584605 RepID=A0ABP3TT61_9FLAO
MKRGFTSGIRSNTQAPKNAAIIAGIPKRTKTDLLAFFPTKNNLNTLLKKCTIPVKAMAISTGKKIIKTGVRMVPKPKPEKKVKIETKKATTEIMTISTYYSFINFFIISAPLTSSILTK